MRKVGFVVGNRPANPLEFWIGIEKGNLVQLDDVVKVESTLEDGTKVHFYGIVVELYRYLEGVEFTFDSKDFVQGRLPAHLAYVAKVQVSRILEDVFVPPFPGDPVYLARGSDLEKALYFDQMKTRIPAGLLRNGEPAFINYHFLNGKDGAHVSISGVSGVASKTSYALFLLHSILNSVDEERVSAVVFNVKGEDLFFLDKPNRIFKEREEEFRPLYERLGLPPEPFKGVEFFAPPEKEGSLVPAVESRKEGVRTYLWTVREFAEEGLIKFLFTEGEEGVGSFHYVVDKVAERLKGLAEETAENEKNNPSWRGRLFNFDLYGDDGGDLPPQEVESLWDLVRFMKKLIKDRRRCNADKRFQRENEDFCNKVGQVFENWFGTVTVIHAYAFLRRFEHAVQHVSPMVVSPDVLDGESPDRFKVDWRGAPLSVVGINRLHTVAQMFVVGAILKKLFKEKELIGRTPVVYVVLDELNKYAPRGGWSPIKDILLDIAERGRSLGIILIGAQQTASEVEKRVVANAAVKVAGRLDAAEVAAREYDYLPQSYKQRAIILKKGQLILHQPDIPVPLVVSFPFPAWATRKEEVYREPREEELEEFDRFISD
ncbi:MAG: ATP-binding protein [Aquificae bacterium]|nr:ATP-binding protein [Aquificota bacterium]